MTPRELTLRDVYAARRRLGAYVTRTALRHSHWLSTATGGDARLKLESLQVTNSFKLRGAMNAALRLCEDRRRPILVAASAGNHGRALALAAERLSLAAVVFTPATAPETKKAAIRHLGATLRDDAPDYDAAERLARQYAADTGATYISPYNHPDVIAGAATIALELLEDAPDVEQVVVPVGGGGLASGIALALAAAAPHVAVVGVEVDASRAFATALAHGAITAIDVQPSLADGLVGNLEPGSMTFDLVRRHVRQVVSVSEDDLRRAIHGLIAEEHLIAEGAGAAATAALLAGRVAGRGKRIVSLVTGSNIDVGKLIEQGLGIRDQGSGSGSGSGSGLP